MKNTVQSSFVSIAPADYVRFDQKKNSPGRVRVTIIFAADLVNEIMAEREIAEYALPSRRRVSQLFEPPPDLKGSIEMSGGSHSIDEQRPIDITAGSKFVAAQ